MDHLALTAIGELIIGFAGGCLACGVWWTLRAKYGGGLVVDYEFQVNGKWYAAVEIHRPSHEED